MSFKCGVLFVTVFFGFYISLTYYGVVYSHYNNGKHPEIHHTGILHSTSRPQKTKRFCTPHTDLEQHPGLPGPCDNSMVVLDCPDPYTEYLHDPHALNTCGLSNDSRLPRKRKQIIKGPGSTDCHGTDGVLISNASLPVSPKPKHTPGKVPKIVHYVTLGCNRTFTFANYLSVLSVHRFITPGQIFFHGDCTPKGYWWQRTTDKVPNIYFRQWSRTKLIQGKPPRWIEHETDIIRLQVILGKKHNVMICRKIDTLKHVY